MKLHWFTPLPPARTEIASLAARILPVLARRCDLTVWTAQPAWDPALNEHASIRSFHGGVPPWPELSDADYTLYNVGNHPEYHGDIYTLSQLHPGVILLHDVNVHELVANVLRPRPNGNHLFLDVLFRHHGLRAVEDGRAFIADKLDVEQLAPRYPLLGALLRGCEGVILHNETALTEVTAHTAAPVTSIPLPHRARTNLRPAPNRAGRTRSGPAELIVFGFIASPNRRLAAILDALAGFPRKDRLRLHIYGEIKDRAGLQARIADQQLGGLVEVHGFVDEATLAQALDQADLALNLRWPSRGEASASLLRIWEHALPALVTPRAWYRGLPAHVVDFVDPDHEQQELHRHFAGILDEPEVYCSKGRAGRRRLEDYHLVEHFVDSLLAFLPRTEAWRRRAFALDAAERVAQHFLPQIEDVGAHEMLLSRVADELATWAGDDCSEERSTGSEKRYS